MTFRLTTLMYLFALVAASLAAFGVAGIPVAILMLLAWAAIFSLPQMGCLDFVVIAGIVLVLLALLLPAIEEGRESARKSQCTNNMKQLALSILNYHDAYKELPPSAGRRGVNDDQHSWRVLIMPFLESNTFYDQYSFDEPWNGPKNKALLAGPWHWDVFHCSTHADSPETTYFAVTSPQTAWGEGEPTSFKDITDGTSNTILLIEASGRGVHWAEPKDLTFDEAVDLLSKPLPLDHSEGHRVDEGYFYKPSYVRNVAFCDGHVQSLRVPLPRKYAIALLTASGGENVDFELIEQRSAPELDYARVWAFSVFVVLALLPAVPALRPWIWPFSAAERQLREDPLAGEITQIDPKFRTPSVPPSENRTDP